MILGIDGGALFPDDSRLQVGVYRVTLDLLDALSANPHASSIQVYGFRDGNGNALPPNTQWVRIWPNKGYLQIGIPIQTMLHPIDCFIAASQACPRFIHTPILGCVYDVSFLKNPSAYPTSYRRLVSQAEYLVHASSHILTISQATKNDIIREYSINQKKITVAYPPVHIPKQDTLTFAKRDKILYVGALKPGKEIPVLLEAYSRYRKESNNPLPLYLVGGDYWYDVRIDDAIRKYSLETSVVKTGFVSDEKLHALYREARVFVTVSPYEGFCLPAAEAQTWKTPVITVNAGAMPETIGDGGILVTPGDSQALADKIGRITTDQTLWNTISHKAYLHGQHFSFAAWLKNVSDALGSVVLK